LEYENESADERCKKTAGICLTCRTRIRAGRSQNPRRKSEAWIARSCLEQWQTRCHPMKPAVTQPQARPGFPMRHKLAQLPFEQKIRKVGELIRLRQKIKTENVSEEAALLVSLDKATAELDAGKGVPIERAREDIREWAKSPKNSKK